MYLFERDTPGFYSRCLLWTKGCFKGCVPQKVPTNATIKGSIWCRSVYQGFFFRKRVSIELNLIPELVSDLIQCIAVAAVRKIYLLTGMFFSGSPYKQILTDIRVAKQKPLIRTLRLLGSYLNSNNSVNNKIK